jgi:hypothetical protein
LPGARVLPRHGPCGANETYSEGQNGGGEKQGADESEIDQAVGLRAAGDTTDRKNAAGIRIAAMGAPFRAIHFQNGESTASST